MDEAAGSTDGCDERVDDGEPETGPRLPLKRPDSRRRKLLAAMAAGGSLSLTGCLGLYTFGTPPEEWAVERGIDAESDDSDADLDDGDDAGAEDGEGQDGDAADGEDTGVETYAVRYLKQGETIDVPAGQNLLEAGEAQGWNLPYQCRRGICGTCTARLWGDAHERVVMEDPEDPTRRNQFLTDEEIADGFTLTCVGYARSEFTLETGERNALDR